MLFKEVVGIGFTMKMAKRLVRLPLVMGLSRLLLLRFLLNMETKFGFLMKRGIRQDLVLHVDLLEQKLR